MNYRAKCNTPLIVRFREKERYTNQSQDFEEWDRFENNRNTVTSMLDLVTFFEIYIAGIRA